MRLKFGFIFFFRDSCVLLNDQKDGVTNRPNGHSERKTGFGSHGLVAPFFMKNTSPNFIQKLGTISSWFFGVFFILIGFTSISDGLFGILMIILGMFLLPPITKLLEKKTHKKFSGWRKPLIAICFFIFASILENPNEIQKPPPDLTSLPSSYEREVLPPIVPDAITKEEVIVEKEEKKEKQEPIKTPVVEIVEEKEVSSPILKEETPPIFEKKTIPVPITEEIVEEPAQENTSLIVPVVKVVDGDTLAVRYNGEDETLRLLGIDTPETKDPRYTVQCFGKEASAQAEKLLNEKNVILETEGERGKYQRLLAYIRLESGEDYGEKMIRDGYAWHYRSYPHDRMDAYDQAERFARENNKGLWTSDTCNGEKKALEEVVEETKEAVSTIIETTSQAPTSPPIPISETKTKPQAISESLLQTEDTFDCSGNNLNCGDFDTHLEAQKTFDYCLKATGQDIHKLDRDEDGIVCESLP